MERMSPVRKLRIVITSILLVFVFTNPVARGQSVTELEATIQALIQQVMMLQEQLKQVEREQDMSAVETPAELIEVDEFTRDLSYGMRNHPDVVRLQEFLIERGFLASGLNTGNYYTKTTAAIQAYQRARNLPVTGHFGPMTRSRVNADLAQKESVTPPKQATGIAPLPETTPKPTPTNIPTKIPTPGATLTPAPQTEAEPVILSQNGPYIVYQKPQYDLGRIERLTQEFVNAERTKQGLAPLTWHTGAADTARLHSDEQALDNTLITDSRKPCSYPYIRHQGFTTGLNVGDRLKHNNVRFRIAGENIAAYAVSHRFIYRYPSDSEPIVCKPLPEYTHPTTGETLAEAQVRVQKDIDRLVGLVTDIPQVTWVNKEWLGPEQIAQQMVDGWMASDGHRRNILDTRFSEGGVGIATVNDYFIATHILLSSP